MERSSLVPGVLRATPRSHLPKRRVSKRGVMQRRKSLYDSKQIRRSPSTPPSSKVPLLASRPSSSTTLCRTQAPRPRRGQTQTCQSSSLTSGVIRRKRKLVEDLPLASVPRRPPLSLNRSLANQASSTRHKVGGLSARAKTKLRQAQGLSVCQTHKVAPSTELEYREVYAEIVEFSLSCAGFDWDKAEAVDGMLTALFDDRALDGVHAGWSGKAFSSVGFYQPQYAGVGRYKFPRAKAAQAGWKKLTPSRSRLPVTFELMSAIFHTLWAMGRLESGLVILLCFALYLRPSEAHRVKCKHVVPPQGGVSGTRHATVVLNPYEDGRASKTHEYDESLLLDCSLLPALGRRLLKLAQARVKQAGKEALLFTVSQAQVATDLREACRRLRVPAELDVVMYMFRHAGASTDFALKLRPLAEIKLRGRWKSDASLRRYEKGGRLADQLQRLPPRLRIHAKRCADCVNNVLAGSASPLLTA